VPAGPMNKDIVQYSQVAAALTPLNSQPTGCHHLSLTRASPYMSPPLSTNTAAGLLHPSPRRIPAGEQARQQHRPSSSEQHPWEVVVLVPAGKRVLTPPTLTRSRRPLSPSRVQEWHRQGMVHVKSWLDRTCPSQMPTDETVSPPSPACLPTCLPLSLSPSLPLSLSPTPTHPPSLPPSLNHSLLSTLAVSCFLSPLNVS
jgi:hypothetical protein